MRCASFLLIGEQPYARTMVESLKAVHDCPVIQMTDMKTQAVAGVDQVVRLPFKIPLMPYRMKHLAAFDHDEMLIVDTDVIAKKSTSDVWKCGFDVALTVREAGELYDGDGADIAGDMPFNTGVMFSRSPQFWRDCYNWLITQDADIQRWYGDQMAVAEVAKRQQYDILLLHCSEFNWAPCSRTDTSKARFWHYKGATRKKWIRELGYSSATTNVSPSRTTSFASQSSSTRQSR